MPESHISPETERISLPTRQALDLIEKLLRDVEVVEFAVRDDLSVDLRPAGVEHSEDLPPTPGQDGLVIDIQAGEVRIDGKPAPVLTGMEMELLSFLYERAPSTVPRDALCQAMWPERPPDGCVGALDKLISRLRRKIEPDPSHHRFLITVRGRGYRLNRS